MAQSAQHLYRKVSHVVNGSQYFHQLCKRVVLSAWLLHSAVESNMLWGIVEIILDEFVLIAEPKILLTKFTIHQRLGKIVKRLHFNEISYCKCMFLSLFFIA